MAAQSGMWSWPLWGEGWGGAASPGSSSHRLASPNQVHQRPASRSPSPVSGQRSVTSPSQPTRRPEGGRGLASLPSSRSFFPASPSAASGHSYGGLSPQDEARGGGLVASPSSGYMSNHSWQAWGHHQAPDYGLGRSLSGGSWQAAPMVPPGAAEYYDPGYNMPMPTPTGAAPAPAAPPGSPSAAPVPPAVAQGEGLLDVDALRMLGCSECADCGKRDPSWASVTFGTIICEECAAVHHAMVKKRKATDSQLFSHLWGESRQGGAFSEVLPLHEQAWDPDEIQAFIAKGGNSRVNAELARSAGMLAPMPPPDTPRLEINRHITRKYGGQLLAGPIPPLTSRKFFKKRSYEAVSRADPSLQLTAPEDAGFPHQAPAAAAAPVVAAPCSPPARRAFTEPGLVVAEVLRLSLSEERAHDLRGVLNPMPLSLKVILSVGRASAQPTKSSQALQAAFSPPARREIPWDMQEPWLWCRVEDYNLITGTRLAAVACVDMLAVANWTPEVIRSSGEIFAELFAADDDDEMHPRYDRAAELAGPHGLPGHHGPLPAYAEKEREDVFFLFHGLWCGTLQLRFTLMNMRGH